MEHVAQLVVLAINARQVLIIITHHVEQLEHVVHRPVYHRERVAQLVVHVINARVVITTIKCRVELHVHVMDLHPHLILLRINYLRLKILQSTAT